MNVLRKIQAAALILAVICTVGCGEKKQSSNNNVSTPGMSAADSSNGSAASDDTSDKSQQTMRVGAEKYGYIDIPESWIPFVEEGHEDSGLIQYSDLTVTSIVTLNYYEGITAEEGANNLYNNLAEDPTAIELNISTIEIDGIEAYQILTHYNDDNTTFAAWLLDGDDGYVHYIAIEGTEPESFNFYETFKVNE